MSRDAIRRNGDKIASPRKEGLLAAGLKRDQENDQSIN
jgi:hypothetical protein